MRLAHLFNSSKSTLAAAVAVGGVLLSVSSAFAQYPTTTISQSTFKNRCTSMGGTLDTGGTSQISICKLPGGQTVTCDFATSPAICIVSRLQAPYKDLLSGAPTGFTKDGGKTAAPADTSPGTLH